MFKSKLQELCQKKGWILPDYATVKEGPNHIPKFTATVQVNGQQFETPKPCKSSKEAQNFAAQIAYNQLVAQPASSTSSSAHTGAPAGVPICPTVAAAPVIPTDIFIPPPPMPPARFLTARTNLDIQPANQEIKRSNCEDNAQDFSSINLDVQSANKENMQTSADDNALTSRANTSMMVSDDKTPKDLLHIYKNRLQQYAQKKGISLPSYTYEFEGPPHARRFKSKVCVGDKVYEVSTFFSTLKDAEHAAAKFACEALLIFEIQEDKGLYKNLLQVLAQKRGLKYPSYQTSLAGPPHKRVFMSTVEIGSDTFTGTEAKSKKQAEMNVAEVAYIALTQGSRAKRALEVASIMEPGASNDLKVDEKDITNEGSQVKEVLEVSPTMGSAASNLEVNVQPPAMLTDEKDSADGECEISAVRLKTSSENVNAHVTGSSCVPNSSPHQASSHAQPVEHLIAAEPQASSIAQPVEHLIAAEPQASSIAQPVEHPIATEPGGEPSVEAMSSPQRKTVVFPRSTNMPIPGGAVVQSYSDDQWIAYKV